ncbi:MAG: formate-dependent phosphoribosylglycinamide formyltransferase [Sulfolobales archaeon]
MTIGKCRDHLGTPLSSNSIKVLLLGGGEIGKEIALEAHKLGIEVVVVDRYDNAPAMHIAHRKYVINMLDGDAIKNIVRRENPNLIIPEIEAINTEALKELEAEGCIIAPNAEAVKICMNRIELRNFISKSLGLPTTNYFVANDEYEVIKGCDSIGYPCIIKPEMSSSGHGHVVVNTPLKEREYYELYRDVLSRSRGNSRRVIVEEFVKLNTEFTILTYRSLLPSEEVITDTLEPIEHWRYGKFHYIESWQPSMKPADLLSRCREYSMRVVNALGGLGIYGVELFLTSDGRVLVSEVAPRPHDTGFVTLVTQDLNEFAIHLRSSLRLPVAKVNLISAGASYAVYAEEGVVWGPQYYGLCSVLSAEGVDVRIFGKPSTYPGRRVAVLIARGLTVDEARSKLHSVKDKIRISCGDRYE